MSVGRTSEKPAKSVQTNLKTPQGLPVFFIDPNPADESPVTQEITFAGNRFRKVRGRYSMREPDKFDWANVTHRAISGRKWGDFVKDSGDQLYFVTQEGKFAPTTEDVFNELGRGQVQTISPEEEEEDLPLLITKPIKLPSPRLEEAMRQSIEGQYQAEKERYVAEKEYKGWLGPFGLFAKKPIAPVREDIEAGIRGRYGVGRYLPPREKEAIGKRTEEIIKG